MKKLWKEARLSDKILVGLLVAGMIGWSATAIHANMTNNNVRADQLQQTEEAQEPEMITVIEAREIAVDLVGGGEVIELDLNADEETFDVIVYHDSEEFQVVLNATDGSLIHLESLTMASDETIHPSGEFTAEEAIETAREYLATIGITDATLVYSYSDMEDGIPVWSIEFRYNGRDLEFYVVKATGDFLKYPTVTNDNNGNNSSEVGSVTPALISTSDSHSSSSSSLSSSNSSSDRPSNPTISQERAIEIANEHLALNGHDTATFEKIKMDFEYGRWVWEVEFRYGRGEIEFYIDVNEGSIVKFEVDID